MGCNKKGPGVVSAGPRTARAVQESEQCGCPEGQAQPGGPVYKVNARHKAGQVPKPLERFEAGRSSVGTGTSAVLILHCIAALCKWLLFMMAAVACGGAALWFFAAPFERPQDTLALWLLAALAGWLAREAYQAGRRALGWEP